MKLEYGNKCRAMIYGVPLNVVYVGQNPDSGKHIIIGAVTINGEEQIFARSFRSNKISSLEGQRLNFEGLNLSEEKFAKKILRRML